MLASSKNLFLKIISGFLIISLFFPRLSLAQINDWQKGASIYPNSTTDFSTDSFKKSVSNLKSTNANYVSLIIPYYQSSDSSSDIFAGWNTPTDESLVNAVNYIHSQGMKVMFNIHVDLPNGEWRRYINASDRNSWFKNYGSILNHYASLAQSNHVEEYCIGTELYEMTSANANSSNTDNWKNLIKNIRDLYSGLLTYSAQHATPTEELEIQFWDKLDFIGLSAYFLLDQYNQYPSVDTLKSSWNDWNNQIISPLSQKWNKPILFTEVGYKSVTGAHAVPGLSSYSNSLDQAEQARDYEALFQYWNDQSFMKGVLFWDWKSYPDAGGQNDPDYTPQNKQAQTVMTNWFSGSSNNSSDPSPTPTPIYNNANYQTKASILPVNPAVDIPMTITANVKPDNNTQDIIIDLEIYDNNGSQVFQKYFEHQNINANQDSVYTINNWSTNNQKRYTVKIGIFNNNWNSNYQWNDNALTFDTGTQIYNPTPTIVPSVTLAPTQTPSAPPQSQDLQVWWPTDNGTISGTQPFKAMLTNTPIDSYKIYWQVDGDQLNEMSSNSSDYPHKETSVDVSNWNWKGNGPYSLKFIAKDSSGNTLKESTLNLNVSH